MEDLALLGIAPSSLAALYQAGFKTTKDLNGINPRELSNVAKISLHDAAVVMNHVKGIDIGSLGISAFDLLENTKEEKSIQTLLPDLDKTLGGGIAIGEITEICGVPGIGKTQMRHLTRIENAHIYCSIHLALCAQLGDTGDDSTFQTIYIDSEGSFLVPRVKSMAESIAQDFCDAIPQGKRINKDDLLRGLIYYRVYDYQEQHDVLLALTRELSTRPKVRLIVLDSVAFHCRYSFDDPISRSRALHNMVVNLRKILNTYQVAIVLINHVTMSVVDGSESVIVPALGDAWSHSISTRLLMSWEHNIRTIQVVKSISAAPDKSTFEVTERGIRPFSRKRSRSEGNSPLC